MLDARALRRYAAAGSALVVGLGVAIVVAAVHGSIDDAVGGLLRALSTELLVTGIALAVGGVVALALWVRLRPPADVLEVECTGVLQRDPPGTATGLVDVEKAIEAVEAVDEASTDDRAHGLLVHVDSPGGPVGPSIDLARAIAAFDGPTAAVAGDTCASGGYMVAAACDRVFVREHSVVGSIGVTGSRPIVAGLRDRLDVEWLDLSAGDLKEAGNPMRHVDDDERDYLQGLTDAYYRQFVAFVAANRQVDEAAVEATEARVFVGDAAVGRQLADAVGDDEAAREWLADRLGTRAVDLETRSVDASPSPLGLWLGLSPAALAFAFGRGVASGLDVDVDVDSHPRVRARARSAVRFAYRWR